MKFCDVIEPYQAVASDFLLEGKHRALFAGCGLGKTATCLYSIARLFSDGALRGVLVVAPLRVCNITWPKEVMQWEDLNWLEVANLRTPEGLAAFKAHRAHIYVINYEALPTFCAKHIPRKGPLPFDLIIWDEISKAKNPSSMRVNAMRKHWDRIDRHWGLTGTPSPNHKLDLFAQYRLLDGGQRLGKSYVQFRETYFYAVDYEQYTWVQKRSQELAMESRVSDMTLVLKSSDYLNIPDTTVEDVEVSLPEKWQHIYKKLAKELFVLIDNHEVEAVNAAVLIGKLLQVTSGSVYSSTEDPSQRKVVVLHDAKVNALRKLIAAQKGAPLMVAYAYQHERDRLLLDLPEAVAFSDATTMEQQDAMAEAWNMGAIPVLLVHPASVGHGLNLQHGGTDICWYTPPWSRELYDQLNARLARKGQKYPTRIFRLICPKTMDDAVVEALHQKGTDQAAIMDAIDNFRRMGDPGNVRVSAAEQEILNLLQ